MIGIRICILNLKVPAGRHIYREWPNTYLSEPQRGDIFIDCLRVAPLEIFIMGNK